MKFKDKSILWVVTAIISVCISGVSAATYSSTLTTNHPVYTRTGRNVESSGYYYELVRITVSYDDYYIFYSNSATNTDLYGFIYYNSFSRSYPEDNLIASGDDDGDSRQFYIRKYLYYGNTYYMVVTTYNDYTTGSFQITGYAEYYGSGSVTFTFVLGAPTTTRLTTTKRTTTTTTTTTTSTTKRTTTTTTTSTTSTAAITSTTTTITSSTTTSTLTSTSRTITTTTTTVIIALTTTISTTSLSTAKTTTDTTITTTTGTTTTVTTSTTTTDTTVTTTTGTTTTVTTKITTSTSTTTTSATTTASTTITTASTASTTTSTITRTTTMTTTTSPIVTTIQTAYTSEMTSTMEDQITSNPPRATEQILENVITSQSTTTTTTTTTARSLLGCSSPIITFFPEPTTLSSPAQFRKSQDFSISSSIELNCTASLSTITQWTINNCSSGCFSSVKLNSTVITTASELFIPARTLSYGVYEFTLTVQMAISSLLRSTLSTFITITPSGITANLVPLGTSVITSGHEKNLTLDPGRYSVDPDSTSFDGNIWIYRYVCRLFDLYNAINSGSVQSLDEPDHQCFRYRTDNKTAIEYGSGTASNSSVTILAGSLTPNATYQFQVYMVNRLNASYRATGSVIVKVEDTKPQLIVVGCVISTMCAPNVEFQYVNPTTQVALFSQCIGNCSSLIRQAWHLYEGVLDSFTEIVQWSLFTQESSYYDQQLFGVNTSNLTSTGALFSDYPDIHRWRFEATYYFLSENSSSALNFFINQPPVGDYCSIDPLAGNTTTVFTIECPEWSDIDEIKDYSFYMFTTDPDDMIMLASTPLSRIHLHLPVGDDGESVINIRVHIRDMLNAIAQYDIYSVSVSADYEATRTLVSDLQTSDITTINSNPTIQLLASQNLNTVGQVLTSVSQLLNRMNRDNVERANRKGVPAATIAVSPLGSPGQPSFPLSLNQSAFRDFNAELNKQANVLEYLLSFLTDEASSSIINIKLQASTLAKLTEVTNQLTRKTIMIASTRCQQMASALQSIASRTSYEDVRIAASYITQCATNVLTGINAPLQERGSALGLDSERANRFPDDYDTDLELEWSNRRLFADGNDFSWETIERKRNAFYQKQEANIVTEQVEQTFSSITAALHVHINIGQQTQINTKSVFMSLETGNIQSLANRTISQVGTAQVRLPLTVHGDMNINSSLSLRSIMQPLAQVDQSQSSADTNFSTTISFSLLDQFGNEIPFRASVDQPIEITIPRDPNVIIPSLVRQNVTALNTHNQSFYLHFTNLTRENNLTKSFHLEIQPLSNTTKIGYLFIYNFDHMPQLNQSIDLMDGWTVFCPSNVTKKIIYNYFINNNQISNHHSIIYGLRELNATEIQTFCANNATNKNTSMLFSEACNFTADYALRIYTSGCYYLDSNHNWQSQGLTVGSDTNYYETQCFSTHLTTFSAGFLALPPPVNWDYVFSHADFIRNKTVYLTVIVIVLIYVLLMIYSRYKDGKDLDKLGITILPDNHRVDQYLYQIIVFTGHRKDSGTKSAVHFVLGGNDDQTSVRTLADSQRKILQRGGIDAFIMAVPKSLGLLNYLHIWHDNAGADGSGSWFLKYIIIRDLQTGDKTHFLCQQWFAVEKGDGLIERVLPAAGDDEKKQFSYVLSKQAYHSLSDNHLWFSVFSRPASNRFTRVQRCTCCFVLLFLTMFLNILYYDQATESKTMRSGQGISIGPVYITPNQIGTGILVDLLSLFPCLLIVQLFRRTKARPLRENELSTLQQTLLKLKREQKPVEQTVKKSKFPRTLPWWFSFITYGLSFLIIAIAIFITIARGIEFGDVKLQKWLISFICGFFSSIFLTQPVKVLCLAVVFAFFIRNSNSDKEIAGHVDDDELNVSDNEDHRRSISKKTLYASRLRDPINRLDKTELKEARDLRRKEIQTWTIVRQILSYLCFLSVLYVTSYGNRGDDALLQVKHLRHFLLNDERSSYDYLSISTVEQYWAWLEKSFVRNLRAQRWYNGEPPKNLSGFIDDKSNRLIGWATMRQLRITEESCRTHPSVANANMRCQNGYSLLHEERRTFETEWANETTIHSTSPVQNAFRYRSSEDLDTYIYMGEHETYGSGGYVYEFRGRLPQLRGNLSELHRLKWIDERTRGVIIQLSLYNPSVEMLTSVIILAEFLATGGVFTSARFEPLNFQDFTSLFQLIIAFIYMSFIIYFMVEEIRSYLRLKKKYFWQFWCYIEWIIISCSWVALAIYIVRYREINRISELFRKTNGFAYVNLQYAGYVSDVLMCLLGSCCFFGTLKCLRFCAFDQRLSMLGDTLKHAWRDLLSFTVMFAVMFIAFVILFHLQFVSRIWACSSFLHTTQMLFEAILMKFDATDIYAADAFFGPVYFSLFIFFVVFIAMSMFISIISDSFRTIRDRNQEVHDTENDMLEFMWSKFVRWTGIKRQNKREVYEEWDARMRPKYKNIVESFPEKIDQFFVALDRIYQPE